MPNSGGGKDVELTRLQGRMDLLEGRIVPLEAWQKKSEAFHMEMRKRWDHFDGNQEAEAEIQEERHRSNAAKINLLMLLVTILVCLAAWVTFFRAPSNHSFLDLNSENQQVAQITAQE